MWVDPDGNYISVMHGDHWAESLNIVHDIIDRGDELSDDGRQADEILEDLGWVRVNYLGYHMGDGFKVNDKQLPIILKHYEEYKDKSINPAGVDTTGTLSKTLEQIL